MARSPKSQKRRELIQQLARRWGMECRYCGCLLDENGPKHRRPTLDHVVPLSKGGTNHLSNLAISCWRCNHRKGDWTEEDYLVEGVS